MGLVWSSSQPAAAVETVVAAAETSEVPAPTETPTLTTEVSVGSEPSESATSVNLEVIEKSGDSPTVSKSQSHKFTGEADVENLVIDIDRESSQFRASGLFRGKHVEAAGTLRSPGPKHMGGASTESCTVAGKAAYMRLTFDPESGKLIVVLERENMWKAADPEIQDVLRRYVLTRVVEE